MGLTWLFPWGLAGLAALLVPVLLHLARRREQRVLRFAAMRWIPAGRAPRRRLRLQERGLLALRLALLAVAALWLAQPLLRNAGAPQRWLAVSPQVDPAAAHAVASAFDRAVWLTPGLPSLADGERPHATPGAPAAWTSLLLEFTARLPSEDAATILVPDTVTLDAHRLPLLPRRVAWREAPPAAPADAAPPAPRLALRYTDPDAPALAWLRAAIAAWAQDPQLRVELDAAPAAGPVPRIAAPAASPVPPGGAAPATPGSPAATAASPVPPDADAVLWLGPLPEDAAPATVPLLQVAATEPSHSDTAPQRSAARPGPSASVPAETAQPESLATVPADAAQPGTEAHAASDTDAHAHAPLDTVPIPGHPPQWRALATALHPSTLPALYEPDFPRRLHATLFGAPTPRRIPAALLQEASQATAAEAGSGGDSALSPRGLRDLPLSPHLAWLLLALFLLERWFASGRRLGRAP